METPKTSSKHPQSKTPSSKVRVVVKVRPFLPSEILANSSNPSSCVSALESEYAHADEVVVQLKDQFTSRKECYKLDSFYGENSSVNEIFQKEVTPLISGIFHGCNATIFACGATGSGKTHLMQGSDELPGLFPMSMSMVLNMCEMYGSTAEISYYEVYMDKCYDLLEPKEREISVLDDKDGQVHLRGLSKVPVSSIAKFQQILSLGMERRKVAHTDLNDVSSRSHGVLVIGVSSPSCNGSGPVVGKMNLIDLAGNEDNGRTGNDGIRLQESAKINRSLFALSNVIYALNNNKPRVPYRESKLTRILQDSLGGKSHSLMVACLNPGEYHESVNTVSLASRSRQITNYMPSAQKTETPSAKIDMEAKLNAWLESKGKTKSVKRVIAFASPLPSKTPLSTTRSIKKKSSCRSSIIVKGSTDKGLANARRNLFKSGAPVDSSMKEDMEESKKCFRVTQVDGVINSNDQSYGKSVTSQLKVHLSASNDVEELKDCFSVAQIDDMRIFNDESCEKRVTSPLRTHLGASNDVEESKDCLSVTPVDDMRISNDEGCEKRVTLPLQVHLGASNDVEESKDFLSITSLDDMMISNDVGCEERFTLQLQVNLDASNDVEDSKEYSSVAQVDDMRISNDEHCEKQEMSPLQNVEESKDCFGVEQINNVMIANSESCDKGVTSPLKEVEDSKDFFSATQLDDDMMISNDESFEKRVTSPHKDHLSASNIKGANANSCTEDMAPTNEAMIPESKVTSPDELLKNVKSSICTPSNKSMGSPAVSEKKIRALQNSLRKALSPIDNNSNMKLYEEMASKSPSCIVPFDPKTPKTPSILTCNAEEFHGTRTPLEKYNLRSSTLKSTRLQEYDFLNSAKTPKTPSVMTCNGDEFQGTKTPLDKYNIRSSNLKSTLAQEYVEFLNSASKEELVKLKGIGQKRADHILQLRETTPLKSLSDLEMIGLSAKQVKGLFRRAARGIFD